MRNISDMYKKEIMSTDGKLLGTLMGVSVMDDWTINGLTVKIERDAIDELRKKKPFLGTLRLDVGVENVTAVGDNILLNKTLKEIGGLLTDYHENNDSSTLLKMPIVDSKGKDVGWVQDVMMDDRNWKVPSLLINLNNETADSLKSRRPAMSNPEASLSINHISGAGDKVMLSVTVEQLETVLEQAPAKSD